MSIGGGEAWDSCIVDLEALSSPERGDYRNVYVKAGSMGVWFRLGVRSDQVMVPFSYCSCSYFLSRLRERPKPCPHLKSLAGSIASGRFRVVEASVEEAVRYVAEVLASGYAYSLRAKLALGKEDVGSSYYSGEEEGSSDDD